MTDSLSRLRAGLDRDEAIARAAAEQSPRWTDGYESEAWAGGYSDSLGEHTFGQIERHSPSRVLRQSEAFRQLIAWQSRAAEDEDREPGMYPPLESETLSVVLGILASIYPEDTTETKGEQ